MLLGNLLLLGAAVGPDLVALDLRARQIHQRGILVVVAGVAEVPGSLTMVFFTAPVTRTVPRMLMPSTRRPTMPGRSRTRQHARIIFRPKVCQGTDTVPSVTEAEVRALLNGNRAEVLLSLFDRAWEQYKADGRKRHYRVRANIVWDNAVTLADEELVSLPGVERRGADDMPVYVFDDVLAVTLKKTTRDMYTSGVRTRRRRVRLSTGMLDGMPHLSYVTCGYTLDKAEAGIEFYPVVRTVSGKPEWNFDLREIVEPGSGLASTAPILPYGAVPSLPTIRPVAKEEGRGSD